MTTRIATLDRLRAQALRTFAGDRFPHVALRVGDKVTRWEATDGHRLILLPVERPALDPGVYLLEAPALRRCATLSPMIRVESDDVVMVRPAKPDEWMDIDIVIAGPFTSPRGDVLGLAPRLVASTMGALDKLGAEQVRFHRLGGVLDPVEIMPVDEEPSIRFAAYIMPCRVD